METVMRTNEDETCMPEITFGEPLGLGHGTIDGGILSHEGTQELVEQVKEHLVAVDPNAPSTCIDGRPCGSCMDGGSSQARPSVAGGGLLTAYAAAELIGWFENDLNSSAERLRNVGDFLKAKQFKFGAHCDESAVKKGFKIVTGDGKEIPKTGCGADDRLVEIIVQPHENSGEVSALTAAILDYEFNKDYMQFMSKEQVTSHTADWNPKQVIDNLGSETANNIEILQGEHSEVAVVFNYIENTTIDRDAFVATTGKQVFVVDMWYLAKLARAMARGTQITTQEKKLQHAMAAYQVATYLTLCNGSQRPIFVK